MLVFQFSTKNKKMVCSFILSIHQKTEIPLDILLLILTMQKYECVLIFFDIVNFNVHVCCPDNPVVKELLNLIDSFNLVQSVVGSTQERGHTLDLVLLYGLPIPNIEICDAVFSDHMPA